MSKDELANLYVGVSLDSTGFQQGVSKLNRELKVVQSEFKAASAKLEGFGTAQDQLQLKSRALTDQIGIQSAKVQALKSKLAESISVKGDDAKATQNLKVKLNKAEASLATMKNQLLHTNDAIAKESSLFNGLGKKIQDSGKHMKNLGRDLFDAGQGLTIGLTVPIAGTLIGASKAAIDFQSAFTGVKKTINGSKQYYDQLAKGIRNMAKEIPSSTTEIANVAAEAGQLGVKKKDILAFTKTMIDLGNSTDLSSMQAADSLAKLANITQMPQDKFRNLGSTITSLGNHLAATESEITDMAMRIAGAGHTVGMSEPQILGFAGALSSVGIQAEMGGSAISRVMVKIASAVHAGGKQLDTFAQVAGMSTSQFKKEFEKNAAGAIVAFINGLGKMQKSGKNVFGTLDKLKLSQIRVRDTLLRAAGAGDLFNKALKLGNQAWQKNTALTNEANQRYSTTASKLKITWNKIKDVAISLGDALLPAINDILDSSGGFINFLKEGVHWFTGLNKPMQNVVLTFAGIAAVTGPFMMMIGPMVSGLGALTLAFGALDLSAGAILLPLAAVVAALGVTGLAVYDLSKKKTKLRQINLKTTESMQTQHTQNAKMINQLGALRSKSKLTNAQFAKYMDLQTKISQTSDPKAIAKYKDQMDKLRKKSGLTNGQLNHMVNLNKTLAKKVPGATKAITDQGNRVADDTNALKKNNAQLEKNIITQLRYDLLKAKANKKVIEKNVDKWQKRVNQDKAKQASLEKILEHWSKKTVQNKVSQLKYSITQLKLDESIKMKQGLSIKNDQKQIKDKQKILHAMQQGKNAFGGIVADQHDSVVQDQKQLNKWKQKLSKIKQIKAELKAALLVNAGIDHSKASQLVKEHKGVQYANQQINKEKSKLAELRKQTPANQRNLSSYKNQVVKIQQQIDKWNTVKHKIEGITGKAQHLNNVLAKAVVKRFNVETVYTSVGHKPTVYSSAGEARAIKRIRGFATGTNYAPGGEAIVGENGPELVYLPRGSKVIPNDKTEQILSAMRNIPMLATGGEILRSGLALVGEKGRELVASASSNTSQLPQEQTMNFNIHLITPDGRELARFTHKYVTEFQQREQEILLKAQGL